MFEFKGWIWFKIEQRGNLSVGIWDVPMNQSALTKFLRILGISTVWTTISLSNVKFRVVQNDTLISRAFADMLNQSTAGFLSNIWNILRDRSIRPSK